MANTKNAARNSKNAGRDIKVLREKRSISGDVLALTASLRPPGYDHVRSRFRVTRRSSGAETVLLSEDFYVTAQFDAEGRIEPLFYDVLDKFEIVFEAEAAKMDADDAATAVDNILQVHTHFKKGMSMSSTENAWRDGRVLHEKHGLSGDVIALKVDHRLPGPGCARSRFRITKRSGDGIEDVLLSEEMYAIAQFDADGNLEVLFDVVLADFENEFKQQSALMDAADAACAIDQVLSGPISPRETNNPKAHFLRQKNSQR